MSDYILSCESTCDLSHEHLVRRDIRYIRFHFSLNGKDYFDDLGQSIPYPEFYDRRAKGERTHTSQVSVGEYLAYFEPMRKEGKDILHVTLSSELSGSYNSACVAANRLREKYPQSKLYIVDSLGASSGYGLIRETLADRRDEGKSIDEIHRWIEEHKLNREHWFFSTDLQYYVRGGRISKASGFFGTLLRICPLLNRDEDGKLRPREKIRTIKKVEEAIVEKRKGDAANGKDYTGKVFISQSNCIDRANPVKDAVEAYFTKRNGKVVMNWIGTTIGSHTGPGTVALFYWGKKRTS